MEISVLSSFDPFMLKVKVKKTDTVFDLKEAVAKAMVVANRIPNCCQQLSVGRRILLDDDPLSVYKIKKNSVLWL